MDFNQFNKQAKELGYNLDTFTMMDAYAEYEVSNKTIEACLDTVIEEELEYSLNTLNN
jgi:hypothetical protein